MEEASLIQKKIINRISIGMDIVLFIRVIAGIYAGNGKKNGEARELPGKRTI
jgi:hypothetical protein